MYINTIEQLKSTIYGGGFLRWTLGYIEDRVYKYSRDHRTGEVHNGLSAIEINPYWSEKELIENVLLYKSVRDAFEYCPCTCMCHIYNGDIAGIDSDGHKSIINISCIGVISMGVIYELEKIYDKKYCIKVN